MKSKFVSRVYIIIAAVLLVAAVLVGRLYILQIVHGEELSLQADRQYTRPDGQLFDRGSIFFVDKTGRLVSAATLTSGFTLAMVPGSIKDPETTYTALSKIVPINREDFFARAAKKDDPYEELMKRVPVETGERVSALKLSGIRIFKERWRYYPGETLAAQTIGFVGSDGDHLAGRYGLERFYEDILKRESAGAYVNFFAEIFANVKAKLSDGGAQSPGDVITSIEPSLELELEKTLEGVMAAYRSRLSGGIIMNPKTGAIYAMAITPSFDVNMFQAEKSPAVYANSLVENVYEMGSIMKPITMAIGLDTGAVAAATTYYDAGSIVLNKAKVSNFDGKGRGRVSMQEVLNQSLNTGAAFVEQKVGNERFAEYIRTFGFGEPTGIDLPNEAANLLDNLGSPRDLEYATASFGQGIAVSPIAMARALSVLANGGVLVTPHLASELSYESGFSKAVNPPPGRRVLKEETSEEITRMLVEVVDTALRGGTVKIKNYSVAAKTGTAQIAKEGERGYHEDRFLHSFFGYVPAYDPDFLIFLYTVEPKDVRFASETLTVPFMNLVHFLINYYEIPPDR